MTKRHINSLFFLILATLFPSLLVAQDSSTPQMEYKKLQRPSDTIGALGFDLFGEQTDFYTGQTSFNAIDIQLPGNNSLPVQLSRKKNVQEQDGFAPLTKIGDWELEVPYIEGTFSSTKGWIISGSSPNSRCSQGSGQPVTVSLNGETFYPNDYWHGYQMVIPGAGGQDLLLSLPTTKNRSVSPSRWTTKNHWLVDCLGTLQSGGLGEGFVATAPDGSKYFFNKMISRGSVNALLTRLKRVIGTTPTGGTNSVILTRAKIFLVAGSMQDRFGNTVTYTYNTNGDLTGINSSDGRSITLVYTSGILTGASTSDGANTRTWQYFYAADGKLSSVKQPDNTSWTYQSVGSTYTGANDSYIDSETGFSPCYDSIGGTMFSGAIFTYTVGHPSGASGTFAYAPVLRGKSHAPRCGAEVAYLGLSKKTVTGPGQPTSIWSYSYSNPNRSMDLAGVDSAHYFSNVYLGSTITDCQITACAQTDVYIRDAARWHHNQTHFWQLV
jgi:YD repeat-containing protein